MRVWLLFAHQRVAISKPNIRASNYKQTKRDKALCRNSEFRVSADSATFMQQTEHEKHIRLHLPP